MSRDTPQAASGVRSARELSSLLSHPAIWRGRSVARTKTFSTGFPALDEGLPGGGWPRAGLIEILPSGFGVGELSLLLPALAAVSRRPEARGCAWVAPPLQPFAPALAEWGVALERMFVVNTQREGVKGKSALWAFEQTLRSGACDIALAWLRSALPRQIRRLHLAAERGATLGVLFRPREAARDASPAALRVAVEPVARGARVTLLKSRGGARGAIELPLR
ncbi:MAG TPA: translesion DNA synthesis-associated protein ImuA [Steroidobacteraceae bacterium]|nr:translesion DNA synthesis-associated protein ImuA [Steroidobacteraceae bacterium]